MNITLPNTAQTWATLTCLLSGILLSGALYFEFILGLAPCPLCVMQRIWFVLTAVVAYVSLLHNPRWGIYPLIGILFAAIGVYFSSRQLWLQSLPEDQVPSCGPDLQYMIDVFPMSDLLEAMTQGTGDCAKTAWSFIGVTLPGWALLGFVTLIGFGVMQLRAGLHR
jgi:disulfide bond formation protein DsbB